MSTQDYAPSLTVTMTNIELRDWFAGMALQGCLSVKETHTALSQKVINQNDLAGCCYEWADAMLAAREGKEYK
jgi:hypothetical protein